MEINKNLSIGGPGASKLSINAGGRSRVFSIASGFIVTISNLTITGGEVSCSDGTNPQCWGGGIENNGTLVLINTTISGNNAILGGGILNVGNLNIFNSTISHNSARDGGGILNLFQASIYNSTIGPENTAKSVNGQDGLGGGIWNLDTLTLTNSTIAENVADVSGGGIDNGSTDGGAFTSIEYCTIYNNTATSGSGGGIQNELQASTSNNQNPNEVDMEASIIADNHADSSADHTPDVAGTFTLTGLNLIGFFSRPGTLFNGTDTKFPPLTGSAGLGSFQLQSSTDLTATVALLPGSQAIGKIPLSDSLCSGELQGFSDLKIGVTTDQRGQARGQGGGCDLGAYEHMPAL